MRLRYPIIIAVSTILGVYSHITYVWANNVAAQVNACQQTQCQQQVALAEVLEARKLPEKPVVPAPVRKPKGKTMLGHH